MRQAFLGIQRVFTALLAMWIGLATPAAATPRTDPSLAGTPIARLAGELQPGEFRPFVTGLPPGVRSFADLLAGRRPEGGKAPPIDTWTDSGQWDPQRKRAFFQGLRQSNRFLSYDAAAHAWAEISLDKPNAPPLYERFGHVYGRTALDAKRGHFYRLAGSMLHRYVIDEDRWEKFERSPLTGYISIDWHEGLDMLVGVSRHEMYGFRDGKWSRLGRSAVQGYHSSAKYNPKRRVMLFIGGNESRQSVDLLTAEGEIRHMSDAPFTFGISSDDLTHDPVSGNFLVLHRDRLLWEYNPDLDEWRVARDMSKPGAGWPFSGGDGGVVPIAIDELGVILWNHSHSARLYRHRSVFAPGERAEGAGSESIAPRASLPKRDRSEASRSTQAGAGPGGDRAAPEAAPAKGVPSRADVAVVVPASRPPIATGDGAASKRDGPGLIEREARAMQPGEWRNIAHLTTWPGKDEGVSFKSFQYVRGIDGAKGGADGMGWTQNLVYHDGKLMILLMRDSFERALMVMEPDGRFWRINQPEGFDQKKHRRPFNKLTRDDTYLYYSPNSGRANLGRMIRTPLDKPGVFERYGVPIGDTQIAGQFAATFVPEWRRFYAYTPGGKIWSWADGNSAWTSHGDLPVDENGERLSGYAGLLLWNPVRKELAIVGGQSFGATRQTSHKVYRLSSPLGAPEMLDDRKYPDGRPMLWGSGSSKLFVDPRDGSYLMLQAGVLYRGACAGGAFEVYEDLRTSRPFGPYEAYAPVTLLPGTDVVVFLSHIRGLVLHRLKPLPATQETPECAARPASTNTADSSARPPAPPTVQRPEVDDDAPVERPRRAERPATPESHAQRKPVKRDRAPATVQPSASRTRRPEREAAPEENTRPPTTAQPAANSRGLSSETVRSLRGDGGAHHSE